MKTLQEIFDQVTHHLLTQKEKSQDIHGCRYRDDKGRSCAVGCLVETEHYNPNFEGVCMDEDRAMAAGQHFKFQLLRTALRDSGVCLDMKYVSLLLLELQELHDETLIVDWEAQLRRVAERRGLTYTPLETAA